MYSNKSVWACIIILAAESVALTAIPSRIPRAIRLGSGGIALAAAAALWLVLRQRNKT